MSEVGLVRSKIYDVYIDESGQGAYFNDPNQPVVVLAGVITQRSNDEFEPPVSSLLQKFNLETNTEIHTSHLIGGNKPYDKLPKKQRETLLYEFIKLGVQFIKFYYNWEWLKPYVREEQRIALRKRNLDPYLSGLLYFMTSMDSYFNQNTDSSYKVHFDNSSDFNQRPKRMIKELCKESEEHYSLKRLVGEPDQLDSANNRFIQLSDAICYILVRNAQVSTMTFTGANKLKKHRKFIEKCCNLIIEKKLPFFETHFDIENILNGFVTKKEVKSLFNDWENRDFSHMGKWLSRKRKEEEFDPGVNTYWKKINQSAEKGNEDLSSVLDELAKVFPQSKHPIEPEAIGYLILEYKEYYLKSSESFQDFPAVKKTEKLFDDTISKIYGMEFDPDKLSKREQYRFKHFSQKFIISGEASKITDQKKFSEFKKILRLASKKTMESLARIAIHIEKVYKTYESFSQEQISLIEKLKRTEQLIISCNKELTEQEDLIKSIRTKFPVYTGIFVKTIATLKYNPSEKRDLEKEFDDFVSLSNRALALIYLYRHSNLHWRKITRIAGINQCNRLLKKIILIRHNAIHALKALNRERGDIPNLFQLLKKTLKHKR